MSAGELFLLSPCRLPTTSTLYLGDDDVAAFLNGYLALWHPAALAGAGAAPRVVSPYDHEQPLAGHVYALPESPPSMLPDDWEGRVRAAGARVFRAAHDRTATQGNLLAALRGPGEGETPAHLLDLPPERQGPFRGIGLGLAVLEALCEAMSHDNLLAVAEFWDDVRQAVPALTAPDPQAAPKPPPTAAPRLQSARDGLCPLTSH